MSTARVFGLVETNREQISLTALGREIVNPEREHQARVKAFLNVPLYRAMFDNYRGCPLPRNIAIENEMVRLGVSAKQKEKARQVFQRSAEQAGFFAYGRDKLVMPSGVAVGEAPAATPPPADDFRAFWSPCPPGAEWPEDKRERWLTTAKQIFGLLYSDSEA